jgi:hypothetical protein
MRPSAPGVQGSTRAGYKGADLFGAHLENTNLFRAHLGRADLRGARLDGANLSWVQNLDRRRAMLRHACRMITSGRPTGRHMSPGPVNIPNATALKCPFPDGGSG